MKVLVKALVTFGLWVCAASSQAGLVTLVGDSINYVYDDSQAALALYGTPMVIGDAVVFAPAGLRAESANGSPTETLLADFVFSSVYSTGPGGFLGPVQVIESGDYSLVGGAVSAAAGVLIEDNNSSYSFAGTVDFDADQDAASAEFWEVAASFNAGPLTDVQVTLRNVLTAASDDLRDYSWIQKKLVLLTASPDFLVLPPGGPGFPGVPAPGVVMLMGLGLVALGWNRRAKSKQYISRKFEAGSKNRTPTNKI